jgi:HNH endonuclease
VSWLRIDDGFTANKKVAQLSDGEFRCWMRLLCHCARLRDPAVSPATIREVATLTKARVRRFAELGLLDSSGGTFEIHDWNTYNGGKDPVPQREETEREHASKKRRRELFQTPELRAAVRARDGDHCRYCNATVNWKDKRGQAGATYDHVDPLGDNTLENIVVACRSCNATKHKRTPEAAGMTLRPPFVTDSDPDLNPDLNRLREGAGATRDPQPQISTPQAVTPLRDVGRATEGDGTASDFQVPELLQVMP